MNKILDYIKIDGIGYLIDKDKEVFIAMGEYFFCKDEIRKRDEHHSFVGFPKIVAIEYPHIIEGLYQFKIEDEKFDILDMAVKKSLIFYRQPLGYDADKASKGFILGFTEGYKANKALYTEEQINDFINTFTENAPLEYVKSEWNKKDGSRRQSLNKSREIESVEVKMIDYCDYEGEELWEITPDWHYKFNENKLLVISKINYK